MKDTELHKENLGDEEKTPWGKMLAAKPDDHPWNSHGERQEIMRTNCSLTYLYMCVQTHAYTHNKRTIFKRITS